MIEQRHLSLHMHYITFSDCQTMVKRSLSYGSSFASRVRWGLMSEQVAYTRYLTIFTILQC